MVVMRGVGAKREDRWSCLPSKCAVTYAPPIPIVQAQPSCQRRLSLLFSDQHSQSILHQKHNMAQDLLAPSQSCAISVSKYPGSVRTAQGTELARLVQHSPSDWYVPFRPSPRHPAISPTQQYCDKDYTAAADLCAKAPSRAQHCGNLSIHALSPTIVQIPFHVTQILRRWAKCNDGLACCRD